MATIEIMIIISMFEVFKFGTIRCMYVNSFEYQASSCITVYVFVVPTQVRFKLIVKLDYSW